MSEEKALRQTLSAHDRALLKRLVDAEMRRREQAALERTLATKRRYEETVAVRKQASLAA